jgi:hypothetical protein
MRVEGETRSVAVVDSPHDIGAAVRHGTNLSGEADGFELGRKEGGGLDLPSWRVLRIDGDEPLEEASEASDIGRIQVLDKQLQYSSNRQQYSQRDWSRPDNGSIAKIRQPRMTLRQPSEAFTTVINAVIVTNSTAPAIVPR